MIGLAKDSMTPSDHRSTDHRFMRACAYPFSRLSSPPGQPLQAARQRRRAACIAGDDENRVVALNRPDGLCKLRAIDGLGERRRLSPPGAKHDELLDAVGAAKELSSGAFERRKRRFGIPFVLPGSPIGAVAGTFDEPQL